MKVLHINEHIEITGGVEVYLQQLQPLLNHHKVESEWMGIKKNGTAYLTALGQKAQFEHCGDLLKLEKWLKEFLDKKSIDLLHLHSITDPSLVNLCIKLRPSLRSLHEPRMFCPGAGKFWRKSERICTQAYGWHCFYHIYAEACASRHPKRVIAAYRNTDFEVKQASRLYKKMIVMSSYMKKEASAAGIPAEKIIVNPYFTPYIEPNHLTDNSKAEIQHFLFVGRLIRHKGVHKLINAMISVMKIRPNIRLNILGSGINEHSLKALVNEHGFADRILFHGWQDRNAINSYMRECYAVVFPSIYPEAFGIVGIEAMMYGKPVIAFNVGGVSEWLKNNENGHLLDDITEEALEKAILSISDDKKSYHRFSANARQMAENKFIPEQHLAKLINVYKECLES